MHWIVRSGRLLVASAFAVALLLDAVNAPPTAAVAEWCEFDPEVVIYTTGGNAVVVHVTNYGLGSDNLAAVQAGQIVPSALPVFSGGTRATDVTVYVSIPNGAGGVQFATRSVVSTGAGATGSVLATATGESGSPMVLRFRLNVA